MDLLNSIRSGFQGVQDTLFPSGSADRESDRVMREVLNLELEQVKENLADLELMLDEVGWREMNNLGNRSWNFKRTSLKKMMDLSRKMYLKNPLMRRSIDVVGLYVWAQGVLIKADDPIVQEVMEDFFDHPKNLTVLTSMPAWETRDQEQAITGNTFIALFHSERTGACRVRTLRVDEIIDIITDPEDVKCPWFYKRSYVDYQGQMHVEYYPDFNYDPTDKPASYGDGNTIQWECAVYHLKTGGLDEMLFGMPELYSVLEYGIAYKDLLTNWATIIKAYARMAMKITGLAGKRGIAAAKSKMQTSIGSGNYRETNPPNTTAGWMALSGGADVSAVRTAGATTSAEEGRPIKLMIAAGAGLPETFYGDSDVGNQATSTTLDRPTELKMVARQKMWMTVIQAIVDRLILLSAKASQGKLNKAGFTVEEYEDIFDSETAHKVIAPDSKSLFVEIKFPNILERNVTDRVRAVVAAITLGGSPAEGIIPDRRFAARLLLEALGDEDAQQHLDEMYDGPEIQGYVDPREKLANDTKVADAKIITADAVADQADVAQQAQDLAKKNANKPQPKVSPLAQRGGSGGIGPVTNRR